MIIPIHISFTHFSCCQIPRNPMGFHMSNPFRHSMASPEKKIPKTFRGLDSLSHRIHGAGIYANIKLVY